MTANRKSKPSNASRRFSLTMASIAIACLLACALLSACGTSTSSSSQAPSPSPSQAPASAASSTPAPSTCGALRVDGTQLVSESGEPVQLKGLSTHGLAWFGQYVNEECFATLKSWGCSVVRLAMYTAEYGGYCTGGDRAQLRALIDTGVQAATNQDLYVIIDWHILSDGNPNTYFDEAKEFFADVSASYANHNNVIYEICNEPTGSTTWADVKSYAEQIIPVIRANDPDAIIIVGTPTWSQRVDQAAADPITNYENIMYALHFYAASHKDDIRAKLVSAHDAGLPVFVTEYSICDESGNGGIDEASAQAWVALLDEYDISYIMWSISNKAETSAILLPSVTKTSGFTVDDLSPAGKWLYALLGGELATGDGAAANPQAATATSGDLKVSHSVKNSWRQDGYAYVQYEVSVTNETGAPVDSWSVDVPIDGPFELADAWNGEYSTSETGLHITAKDYNARIDTGATVGDVGFIVRLAQ